jgi:hypothetical protein
MALCDDVKSKEGAKIFADGLFNFLYGKTESQKRFESYVETLSSLPRKQTCVLTWPLQTVMGFIGNPEEHLFLKPRVTQTAARKYVFALNYKSWPNWETYRDVLQFAEHIRNDNKDLNQVNYIDLQSFIWVTGSDEYPD